VLEPIPKYRDNIGYPRYGESWLSGITNMVKPPAIYRLSPRYHFGHFWCDFCNFRRRRYIRYRDNIGYPRYGESYNIGDNQYSSKNLSYCPINRFLESVPFSIERHVQWHQHTGWARKEAVGPGLWVRQ